MPDYRVELRPAAVRAMGKLDSPVARRLQGAIELLAQDPRPPASKPLGGRPGRWRVRVGDYRVIYTVDDDVLIVLVLSLGRRDGAERRRRHDRRNPDPPARR